MRLLSESRLRMAMLVAFAISSAHAQLSQVDRNVIKEMTRGDLYLRNNVPCRFTSGILGGVGAEPLTEVSPAGVDWEKNLNAIAPNPKPALRGGGRGPLRVGVDTVYWGFGPNDIIRYGRLYFKPNGVVELWAEGAKPKDVEIWIRFVDIRTRSDFKKAYDLILALKPLQDEHPEWPAEIRTAVAERRVIEGMTKEQVFDVVGNPVGIETGEEDGKKIETWFPRQDTGTSGSWGRVSSGSTGFPISLRFVNGKLALIGKNAKSVRPDLGK